MRTALLLVVTFLALPAWPQAPSEERQLQADPVAARQQRLSVLRREAEESEAALKGAERDATAARASLDQARKYNDTAAAALKKARERSAQAHKAYEAESAAFERARKPN